MVVEEGGIVSLGSFIGLGPDFIAQASCSFQKAANYFELHIRIGLANAMFQFLPW